MSEPIAGIRRPPADDPPVRDAAVVILVREGERGRELFWVRRGAGVSLGGGFRAFPGGKVDPDDATLPASGPLSPFAGAAIRETFEEAGILFALGADGSPPPAGERLDALRNELLGGCPFRTLLERERIVLDPSRLVPAGRWVTPAFTPARFDTRFFLAIVPPGTAARVLPGELVDGEWIRPSEALPSWERGEALLHPPTLHAIATLAGWPPEGAIPRLRRPPFLGPDFIGTRIEFQRGILLVPLRTETLPPATHTNAWIAGTGDIVLVDPGAVADGERRILAARLDELLGEGRRLVSVILTHHHADHTAAARFVAERYGVPIRAHAAAASRIPGAVGDLSDGERIVLDGPMPMTLRVLLTEGHARGHVVLLDDASRAVLAGDLVAGGSTIVLDPPEGNLGQYLASLERLRSLGVGTLFPAHGVAIVDGLAKLDETTRHREARLEQVAEAIRRGLATVDEIVREVYTDTPEELHPLAARSALASLDELEARGRARRDGDRWRRA